MGKPRNYWNNKQLCVDEALKYSTKSEFMRGSIGAYTSAKKNGWLDDIRGHMVEVCKPKNHWTFKRCHEEALAYDTRNAFRVGANSAYVTAIKNDWIDDICNHMEIIGNRHKRAIYAIISHDYMVAYIGLSGNPKERLLQHYKKSSNKHVRKLLTNINRCEVVVFDEWYNKEEAGTAEQEILEMFEEEGYEPLNINKTGGLGGSTLMWDFNKCAEEALKYKTRTTFFKGSSGAYDAAWSNGWLDEICSHMTLQQNPKGYWTKERCRDEAGNYPTRTAFQQGSVSASNASWKNGWLDEFFPK